MASFWFRTVGICLAVTLVIRDNPPGVIQSVSRVVVAIATVVEFTGGSLARCQPS